MYIVFPRFRGKGSSDLRKEEGADRGTTLVRCVSRKFERDDKGIGGRLFFAGGGGEVLIRRALPPVKSNVTLSLPFCRDNED